jgi:cobaltochelatase CobT
MKNSGGHESGRPMNPKPVIPAKAGIPLTTRVRPDLLDIFEAFCDQFRMLGIFLITALIVAVWFVAVRLAWRSVPEPKLKVRNPADWKRYGSSGRSLADVQKQFATTDYPIFTTEFDVEVNASDLWTEIGTPKESIEGTWRDAHAKRRGSDLGYLNETTKSLLKARKAGTLLTLLIDHSGSMRGEQAVEVASAVGVMGEVLASAGIEFEVLGFTTRSWKGGEARKKWRATGEAPMPGRLCDLLHIVYKSSGQAFEDVKSDLLLLHKSGLLRENIDGEAILWAKHRFDSSGFKRWVCIVISDGAPVDDSTLSSNMINDTCTLLDDHICKTISCVVEQPSCTIAGLGVKHDVTRYYALSEKTKKDDAILEKLASITLQAIKTGKAKK